MNAPADQQKNEEGGMLVAALAGGAILLAIALVMFSGGDEADEKKDGDEVAAAVDARDKKSGSSKSSFQKRKVDDATRDAREDGEGGAEEPQAALSPANAPHRSSRMVAGAGMQAPEDAPKGPPEFDSDEEERTWWNRQLDGAKMLKKRRVQALEKLDEAEKKAVEGGADPQKTAESFGKKREGLQEALQRSEEKIAEIEKKISEL
jgi:hypothetical protein